MIRGGKRFLFKLRARKINFQQQKQQKINNIPLANIASGTKYKITIEISWQAHVGARSCC
jgi:hypothetical protein